MSGKQPADDHDSINIFERIESICEEFRQAWKLGKQPSLGPLLNKVPEEARQTLFRQLLQADIRYRRQTSESPSSSDYLRRFPEYQRLIHQQFGEPTLATQETPNGIPGDSCEPTVAADVASANRIGEYELGKYLGKGGMGVVYEAKHIKHGNRVALKMLPIGHDGPEITAEKLYRFRKEFRSLSEINHPNLVGMQTLQVDGRQWFFTMDLIDGIDFLAYVRPHGKLSEERLRQALKQIVNGVMALHEWKIIHRDLKPSNVLVDSNGHVSILDFGLVVELPQLTDKTVSMNTRHFVGTPSYAAPEQVYGQRSPASDWYSLGVMLYEALTGERPFNGEILDLIRQKQEEDAPALSGMADIPRDLAQLADELLKRNAEERPDASAIAKAISLDRDDSQSKEGSSNSPSKSFELLVGRDDQLRQLDEASKAFLQQREPMAVFVSGRSGEGKSTLIEAFLNRLKYDSEIVVLSGKCYDRESVPFKAIDSLIDALVAFLRSRNRKEVAALLPEDIQFLTYVFPLLRRVEAISHLPAQRVAGQDSKQIRNRAFAAMRELLFRLSRQLPILLFIDDLQWGDSDSAEAMHRILSPPNSPAIMLLGSYRLDEATASPFLASWNQLQGANEHAIVKRSISVGPLSESQCGELLVERIGIDNPRLQETAKELHRATGGNLYFLEQLVESFNPEDHSIRQVPLNEVIETKLGKLPADAILLLKVIAVSSHALPISEASQAAGGNAQLLGTITHMRSEKLVRLIGSEEEQLVDTYHDKIREAVLGQLDMDSQRRIHLRLGEAIENSESINGEKIFKQLCEGGSFVQTPSRVFGLAYHFEEGRHRQKSAAYSLLAAEQAKAQFALSVAVNHYRIAERQLSQDQRRLNYRLKFGFGSALSLAGRYAEADKEFGEAVKLADGNRERVSAKSKLADIIYKTGSLQASTSASASLLAELGLPVPKSKLTKSISITRSHVRRWLRGHVPPSFRSKSDAETTRLAIEVLLQFTYPCLWHDHQGALWATAIAENLSDTIEDHYSKCRAAAFRALAVGWHQDLRVALAKHERAQKLSRQLNDVGLEALCALHGAACKAVNARFKEAIKDYDLAISKFDAMGDVWRTTITEGAKSNLLQRTGDFEEAQYLSKRAFDTAIKFGQNRLAQTSLAVWARSTNCDFRFHEWTERFDQVPDDLASYTMLKNAECLWHLSNDHPFEALDSSRTAILLAHKFNPFMGYVSDTFPIYAEVLRRCAIALESSNPQKASKYMLRAFTAAKHAIHYTSKSKIGAPYAMRELSIHYERLGRYRRACRIMSKSCQVADEQGAKYESALSRQLHGKLGLRLSLPDAQASIVEAEAALAEFEQMKLQSTIESIQ